MQTVQLGRDASAPVPSAAVPSAAVPSAAAWHHHQLVYHGDQDLALRQVVASAVGTLARSNAIDRFFFIRYELGGPHLRLRWRCTGERSRIESTLDDRARAFFALHPSDESWSRDRIRQANRQIRGLESLPPEDDPAFPDHSWHRAPLQFEVERYGGPRHFDTATDLFMLSSLRALHAIDSVPRDATFQTRVVVELLLSAFAFGLDRAEVLGLANYAAMFFGDRFDACRTEAEERFGALRAPLTALAARCAETVGTTFDRPSPESIAKDEEPEVETWLEAAYCRTARRTSQALGGTPSQRRYTLGSHLHMSANRFGMLNSEEAYLSYLAYLAIRELDRGAVEASGPATPSAADDPGHVLGLWAERLDGPNGRTVS
ncbi:MAG: lantibiotic dehydratase C-terminal domain-containing protein [Acidobacteriota bacterium]